MRKMIASPPRMYLASMGTKRSTYLLATLHSSQVLKASGQILEAAAKRGNLQLKKPEPLQLATISRPLDMNVIGVRVFRGAIAVVAYPGTRTTLLDTPNLAVPDHIVDPGSLSNSDQVMKERITDHFLFWAMGIQANVERAPLRVRRLRGGAFDVATHVDAQISHLRKVPVDHSNGLLRRGLVLIPVDFGEIGHDPILRITLPRGVAVVAMQERLCRTMAY
jgi:hypothetical protein